MSQTTGSTLTEYLIDQQPSLAVVLRQKIGSQNTHYVHGPRGIQSQVANSAWTEAMNDGLGSVRGWIDGSQAMASSVNYNPYGVPDGTVDDFGFTGEMTDANGLVYLRARYYDPNVGVFASLDPFEGKTCTPHSLNGYNWVSGNVANATDPSGMFCIVPVIGWLGCAGSALVYGLGALGVLGAAYANPCSAPNYRHEECQALTQSIQRQMHNVVQWVIDGACDVAQGAIDVIEETLNPPIGIPQQPQSQPAPTPRVGRGVNRNPIERIAPWIARFALDRGIDWVIERITERDDDRHSCSKSRFSLYRGMREDSDGKPLIGESARTLGARENVDIQTHNDNVNPNTGGMSVSPFTPFNLPTHRRPPNLGGTGSNPVWCIDVLNIEFHLLLQYRPDPANVTGHGFIEPSMEMPFTMYQTSLASTKQMWNKVNSQ